MENRVSPRLGENAGSHAAIMHKSRLLAMHLLRLGFRADVDLDRTT
jgi:hypothetical protein